METKHTKGELKQEHRIINEQGMYATEVFSGNTVICTMHWAGDKIGNTTTSKREANAKRIVKCWNMHDELVDLLKRASLHLELSDIELNKSERLALIKMIDSVIKEDNNEN